MIYFIVQYARQDWEGKALGELRMPFEIRLKKPTIKLVA